jgi:hypothetical protein
MSRMSEAMRRVKATIRTALGAVRRARKRAGKSEASEWSMGKSQSNEEWVRQGERIRQ